MLRFFSGDAERAVDIREEEVVARPACKQAHAMRFEHLLHRFRVLEDLLGVDAERGPQGFTEGDCLCRYVVHVRAALEPGED